MWGQKDSCLQDKNAGQYLVVQTGKTSRVVSVRTLLKNHPEVAILDELDSSTALVEMSDKARQRLTREFPDLAVERNLQYKASN